MNASTKNHRNHWSHVSRNLVKTMSRLSSSAARFRIIFIRPCLSLLNFTKKRKAVIRLMPPGRPLDVNRVIHQFKTFGDSGVKCKWCDQELEDDIADENDEERCIPKCQPAFFNDLAMSVLLSLSSNHSALNDQKSEIRGKEHWLHHRIYCSSNQPSCTITTPKVKIIIFLMEWLALKCERNISKK